MKKNGLRQLAIRLAKDDTGATAVEYAIIAALVAVALIGTLAAFRTTITAMFGRATGGVAGGP
jgi:pilus assembly protein Flp/PilA